MTQLWPSAHKTVLVSIKKVGDISISISNGEFMLLKTNKQTLITKGTLKQTKQTLPTFLISFLVDGVYPQRRM